MEGLPVRRLPAPSSAVTARDGALPVGTRSAMLGRVEFRPYEERDLPGILSLCEAEDWPSLPRDPARAARVLTNPGVVTRVAVEDGAVAGFVYALTDGAVQAYIAALLVAEGRRRRGIGRRLVHEAFVGSGAERMDLISTADDFYDRLNSRRLQGFRLWPPFLAEP